MSDIISYPNPILTTSCRQTTCIAPMFIRKMIEVMIRNDGCGLAANQLGVNQRIICIQIEKKDKPIILVNPRIVAHSLDSEMSIESCLSIRGYIGEVNRYTSIQVAANDIHMEPILIEAEGLEAIVMQHEIDHLNGILINTKGNRNG